MGGTCSHPEAATASDEVVADPNDRRLFRLKYASVLKGEEKLAEASLTAIIECALRNNPRYEITGILYYDRSTKRLVQLLEGPACNVAHLFSVILADGRHSGCHVLEMSRDVQRRDYADFGMALARTTDLETACKSHVAFEEHLVRIQYTSTILSSSVVEAQQLLRSILQSSVRNNSQKGIGGLLCFNPTTMEVTQLLEGPAPAVRSLFDTIMADSRHTGCSLTSEELLLSKEEYLFGSSWGLLQSETTETDLLDLSSRVRQVRTVGMLLRGSEGRSGIGVCRCRGGGKPPRCEEPRAPCCLARPPLECLTLARRACGAGLPRIVSSCRDARREGAARTSGQRAGRVG